jgi:branched-chain amino acid transport system permease protein
MIAYLAAPFVLDAFWTSVLIYAAIASVGALGLNLLTGYTGQVSLGHAFFLGAGAYTAAFLSARLGLPFPLWLVGAGLVGGLIGGIVGPFALRLRGQYLVMVTLAMVVIGQHIFENWRSVTGGLTGISVRAPVVLAGLDFAHLPFPSATGALSRNHGFFYLTWGVAAVLALAATNIVRSRPGRAMQAIRDHDIAAEVIGVSLVQYKVGAFVVSSAYAAVAGALYASYARYVSPLDFGLVLSIQYIAMMIVGGVGTISGSILGALFLTAVPRLVEAFGAVLPFVTQGGGGGGAGRITVFTLNQALFGLLIIAFLVFEPLGLAGIWARIRAYFRAWPFSY